MLVLAPSSCDPVVDPFPSLFTLLLFLCSLWTMCSAVSAPSDSVSCSLITHHCGVHRPPPRWPRPAGFLITVMSNTCKDIVSLKWFLLVRNVLSWHGSVAEEKNVCEKCLRRRTGGCEATASYSRKVWVKLIKLNTFPCGKLPLRILDKFLIHNTPTDTCCDRADKVQSLSI